MRACSIAKYVSTRRRCQTCDYARWLTAFSLLSKVYAYLCIHHMRPVLPRPHLWLDHRHYQTTSPYYVFRTASWPRHTYARPTACSWFKPVPQFVLPMKNPISVSENENTSSLVPYELHDLPDWLARLGAQVLRNPQRHLHRTRHVARISAQDSHPALIVRVSSTCTSACGSTRTYAVLKRKTRALQASGPAIERRTNSPISAFQHTNKRADPLIGVTNIPGPTATVVKMHSVHAALSPSGPANDQIHRP